MNKLTPVNRLIHHRLLYTLIHRSIILRLGVRLRTVDHTWRVHQPLQRVSFPSKHIVSMVRVARCVAEAPCEGLAAVDGPVGFVVEFGGVPDDFEEDLRHTDGVRRWAGTLRLEGSGLRIGHVRLYRNSVCYARGGVGTLYDVLRTM